MRSYICAYSEEAIYSYVINNNYRMPTKDTICNKYGDQLHVVRNYYQLLGINNKTLYVIYDPNNYEIKDPQLSIIKYAEENNFSIEIIDEEKYLLPQKIRGYDYVIIDEIDEISKEIVEDYKEKMLQQLWYKFTPTYKDGLIDKYLLEHKKDKKK